MSASTIIVGAIALGLGVSAPAACAVTHPQLSPVSYSGHNLVVRAAERIHLDKPVSSKSDGGKQCPRACSNRKRNVPAD